MTLMPGSTVTKIAYCRRPKVRIKAGSELAPEVLFENAIAYFGKEDCAALGLCARSAMLLNHRPVLQPRIEANFYGKAGLARDICSGFSLAVDGFRLPYEISRKFAAFVDVNGGNRMSAPAFPRRRRPQLRPGSAPH